MTFTAGEWRDAWAKSNSAALAFVFGLPLCGAGESTQAAFFKEDEGAMSKMMIADHQGATDPFNNKLLGVIRLGDPSP